MGTINHGYIDRVKYELECAKLVQLSSPNLLDGIVIIKFARNTDYDGIVSKFSNSLKFIDNGADYINLAF
jgi:hypothetical protein